MDKIIKVTAGNGSIRGFFINSKNVVNTAFENHKTAPVITAGLGRLLTAGLLIGQTLKNDTDQVTLSIKGDGPAKGLVAIANSKGDVKGYPLVNIIDIPLKENGKLDVGSALGYGTINIIKDIGLKSDYTGQTPLISGEIADDLTYYYAKSEQVPTSIALGVLVDKDYKVKEAGGFFIQLMPEADEEVVLELEKKLMDLPPVTELLDSGKTIEEIAKLVLGDLEIKIKEEIKVQFKCGCSRERVERALITVSKDELKLMIEEDKKAELTCHFCNKKYLFTEQYLIDLMKKK